jgi:hypothetical protein
MNFYHHHFFANNECAKKNIVYLFFCTLHSVNYTLPFVKDYQSNLLNRFS